MRQWFFILLIVFIQETVTLNGLLVKVHQGYFSIMWVTILFIIATVLEILVGYFLGGYIKTYWNKGWLHRFATRWADRFHTYIGKHGRKIYLLLLGYFSFPLINAFITAWLDIPFVESFWYLFFGNILFYATSWLLVLGVMSIIPNPVFAFATVIALTIVVTVIMRIWKSQKV
jgi:hypothetical protein